ncbi:hypothetical protein RTBOTA2_003236 [Rhodotorula toruloides]|nr:hypothetical protein RTBOTA2_003236 [Rhodotorula toruloides]
MRGEAAKWVRKLSGWNRKSSRTMRRGERLSWPSQVERSATNCLLSGVWQHCTSFTTPTRSQSSHSSFTFNDAPSAHFAHSSKTGCKLSGFE